MKNIDPNRARMRVAHIVGAAGLVAFVSMAVAQTSSALLPNVARALSRLASMKLFVNPDSPARRQANEWRRSRPDDAALMERIASQPLAQWVGVGSRDVRTDVMRIVARASQQGATPVLVAYNIPNRDCGSLSAGGSSNARAYKNWIRDFELPPADRLPQSRFGIDRKSVV